MTTMTATEARARLPEILDLVARGEQITITRHSVPVAIVVSPEAFRHRRPAAAAAIARAQELHDELERMRSEPLSELSGAMTEEYAEELIRSIRADRDAE
jgi:prevent-host-death family protein